MKTAKLALLASAAVGILITVGPAMAQNASLPPSHGATTLNNGFLPDPASVSVTAGGAVDLGGIGEGCVGMADNAPDYRLNYNAGSLPLYFRSRASSADTTLAVRAPDGRWYCDDDSGGDLNAQVHFTAPRSGTYTIFVGTYGSAGGRSPATLEISELATGTDVPPPPGEMPDPALDATYGSINLRRGFRPDPRRVRLTAGGTIDASQVSEGCVGNIARAPDYQVSYTAGRNRPLIFRATSSGDPTLVINDANGNWVCNDDSNDSLNAEVVFNQPTSGVYDVWVGSFGEPTHQAELSITERRRR